MRSQEPRMLVLDVLASQKTEKVLDLLKSLHTLLVMVPPGCTPLVQPLDVCINKPFKSYIEEFANSHYTKHLEEWTDNKYTASERRVLMTKWVGEAWEKICNEHVDTIRRSFIKCGITTAVDGSEDHLINIRGIDNYKVPQDIILPSHGDDLEEEHILQQLEREELSIHDIDGDYITVEEKQQAWRLAIGINEEIDEET